VSALRYKPDQEFRDGEFRFGLSVSVAAHVIVAFFIFFKVFPDFGDFPEPVVYSISIEGGKSLGGMSQVPKDDKPSPIAPVKNVAAATKQETQPEKEVAKVDPRKEPVEDAEVSVADSKPTPKPTPPKVATPKATPAPTKNNDKATPAKVTKKSDGDELDKSYQAAMQRYLGESSDAGGKGFGAARVGGKGMGGGVVRPPEFFIYEKIVRSRIKEAWRWYDANSSLITVISFDIEPDGVIKNVRLVKSSGDSSYDESVMRAAMKASPLPPPPKSVYEQYFKSVRITFDPRE
jgi:TonB family protein